MIGLYLHIPFCHAKCPYCDFASFAGQDRQIEPYLSALLREAGNYPAESLSTLFIGGGTPTALFPDQIDQLMAGVKKIFRTDQLIEATIEANPESSTEPVLERYQSHGINRISFGVQASQDALLRTLGRLHSWNDFLSVYGRARKMGFANINIDLMYGLPGQTEQDWEETLEAVIKLEPEHVSAYALKVEEGTPFFHNSVSTDDDLEARMYLTAARLLTDCGYSHYEISNFARPGFECRHNLRYWHNEETVGLGLSATSFYRGHRFKNTPQLAPYIQALNFGERPLVEDVALPPHLQMEEDVMLSLRLKEGVEAGIIDRLAHPMFQRFLKSEFASVQGGRYRLTPEGWLLSNQLFQTLV